MLIESAGLPNRWRSARQSKPQNMTARVHMRLYRFWKTSALAAPAALCLLAGCQSHQALAGPQTRQSTEGESQQVRLTQEKQGQQPGPPLTAASPQKGDAAKAAGHVAVAPPQTQNSLTISCEPPIYLFIVDPLGRKQGFDTAEHKMHEDIPNAAIDEAEGGEGGQTVFIPEPVAGQYHVFASGGEPGTYGCSFFGVGGKVQTALGKSLEHLPIHKDETQKFDVILNTSPGAELKLAGGFSPSAAPVNKIPALLSYGTPITTNVVLPTGQREAVFLIFYDEQVDAASFSATLNGALLSHLFHPQAGSWELVKVAVAEHHNRLKLAVRSQKGPAVNDTFEITVP